MVNQSLVFATFCSRALVSGPSSSSSELGLVTMARLAALGVFAVKPVRKRIDERVGTEGVVIVLRFGGCVARLRGVA